MTFDGFLAWLLGDTPSAMQPVTVQRDGETVGACLVKLGIQPWRHGIYCAHGLVKVEGAGSSPISVGPSTQLQAGDRVSAYEPNAAADAELQRRADADAHDYVFAVEPKGDTYIANAVALLERRPRTILVHTSRNDLADFVRALIPQAVQPIRNVIIPTHGVDKGFMRLPVEAKPLNFKAARRLAARGAQNPLHIDESLVLPRPRSGGTPLPFAVEICGCRMGRAVAFVEALRVAFNADTLHAPRHTMVASENSNARVAWIARNLIVKSRTPITDRNVLIAELRRTIGTSDPDLLAALDAMVPPDDQLHGAHGAFSGHPFVVEAGSARFNASSTYAYNRWSFWGWPQTPRAGRTVAPDPGTDARRIELSMRRVTDVQDRDQFDGLYSAIQRWGEASERDLVGKIDWRFRPDRPNFYAEPYIHEYRIGVPYFMQGGRKKSFVRYVPFDGSAPTESLDFADAEVYGTSKR